MRALIIWCLLGAGLIGLKAHLDRTATRYADVAVRAGGEVFYIPRTLIHGDGWRGDLMRLAGCWDAREAGLLAAAAPLAGCGGRSLHLKVPVGPDALRGAPLGATFRGSYNPPVEHLQQLIDAWAGKGAWSGRAVAPRTDWQLVIVTAPGTPWVQLLAAEPKSGTSTELAALYAGRCYRPEPLSDAGMTCEIALRLNQEAALEYSLGPDEIVELATIRQALFAQVAKWRGKQ